MQKNVELVERFYSAFAKLDYQSMQACYSDDILFSDPVFLNLSGDHPKAMWQMLCLAAKDWSLSWGDIEELDDEYVTCRWVAHYTFSATGNKVVNTIKAYMRIRDGKIIEHSDAFRLSTWLAQALGWKGTLFGWTGFMKRAVQRKARKRLEEFMAKHYAAH